jgi:hypothetical protein
MANKQIIWMVQIVSQEQLQTGVDRLLSVTEHNQSIPAYISRLTGGDVPASNLAE